MAESSERELTPDAAGYVAAALCRFASDRPEITPVAGMVDDERTR
jgi:hypothetical protein